MRIDLGGFDKRRLTRVVAVIAVALATGHLVQTVAAREGRSEPVEGQGTAKPAAVVQLAATNDSVPAGPVDKVPLPVVAYAATAPVVPSNAAATAFAVNRIAGAALASPAALAPDQIAATPVKLAPATLASATDLATDTCPVTLDLMVDPGAMLGLTLLAPCHPNARVVVRHAGLAVTAVTTATGLMFLALPALETSAAVDLRFADGTVVSETVQVPDLATLRRFAVQWQGDDAFQLYGFEEKGPVSAANPGFVPISDLPQSAGFLTRLGDANADAPMFAEVYTYPANGRSDVVVEAAVTDATCGRELLGETLASLAGKVTVIDLTLSMPECDAVGDFLVLNNLVQDTTLAAAN